ncbi:MAG: M81 family metallopeptidase, partial [Thermomicrobiales bacterium]|nr:M81 family metallopeptidase [Thermomicrobiales bacterium]
MRFLVGEFAHESNAFSAGVTGLDAFRGSDWYAEGRDGLDLARGTRTVVGGFIDVADQRGHEIVPTVIASTLPSGPVAADAWQHVRQRIVEGAREAGPLDGVLLALHGAMSVEEDAGVADPEGEFVAAVRAAVGNDVPIVVVLDLHSDTTELLLSVAELTLAFNEEPLRDAFVRGVEAATRIVEIREGRIRPAR